MIKRQPQGSAGAPESGTAGTRRRGEALEQAIFDAVIADLAETGYDTLTMEGVASRAQTGKAALYRRWSCKEDLVLDALECKMPPLDDPPDNGSIRADLLDLLGRMADMASSPTGCAMQYVVGSLKRNPDIAQAVYTRVIEPRQQLIIDALRRGADRGEVRPDAVSRLVAQVGPSMIVQKLVADGPPVTRATVESIVDEVVMPMLRP
ncbi:MAG: TetR/AcrR family transcriptional regulator [Mycobacteriales bacterium]